MIKENLIDLENIIKAKNSVRVDKKTLKSTLLEKEISYFFSKYYIEGKIEYTSFEQFEHDIKNNKELIKLRSRCNKFTASVKDGEYKLSCALKAAEKDGPSIMCSLMNVFFVKFEMEEVTQQNTVLSSILNNTEYDMPIEDLTYLALSILSIGKYRLNLRYGEPFKTLIAKIEKANVSSYCELDDGLQRYIKNTCHSKEIPLYGFISVCFPHLVNSLSGDIELDFVLKRFFDLYHKEYYLTLMLPRLYKELMHRCEELGVVSEVYLRNLGIILVPESDIHKLMKFVVGDANDYFILDKERLKIVGIPNIYIASSDRYYQELDRKCRKLGVSLDDYIKSLGYNRIKKSELLEGFKYYFTPSTKSMNEVLDKVRPIIKSRVNADGNVFLPSGTEDYNTVDNQARKINTTVDCLIHKCGYPRFFASGKVLYSDGHEEFLASIYKKRDFSKESSVITLADIVGVKRILDGKDYPQFANMLLELLDKETDDDDDRLYILKGTKISKYSEEYKITKGELIVLSLILGFDVVYEEDNDLILIEATENSLDILDILEVELRVKLNKPLMTIKRRSILLRSVRSLSIGYHNSRKFINSLFDENGQLILSQDNYKLMRELENKYGKTIFELRTFFKESSFRFGQNRIDKPMSVKEINKINVHPSLQSIIIESYSRNQHLVRQLKKLYNHKCQICGETNDNIPVLKDKYGIPYVEVHHMKSLSQQGEYSSNLDVASNCIVVCPHHHKELHLRLGDNTLSLDCSEGVFIVEDDYKYEEGEEFFKHSMKLELNKHLGAKY